MQRLRDMTNGLLRRLPVPVIYIASGLYAVWLLWLGLFDQLGAEPVKALEHALGEAALYMLVLGLAVTPLRKHGGINLLRFRRAIGLACFFFVALHLLTWAVLDVQRLDRVWADIVKRPYITVGMGAFALIVPLALTSNALSVRRLGRAWGKLHRLIYPAAILAALHYVMLVKGFQLKPLVFLGVILSLLALRLPGIASGRRRTRASLPDGSDSPSSVQRD